MNLEALFDDLEAKFVALQTKPFGLGNHGVQGFSKLVWGSDHFAGFVEGTAIWQIVALERHEPVALTAQVTPLDGLSFKARLKQLVGLWVRLETPNQTLAGRLKFIDGKLLVFQDFCVHLRTVKTVSLHAVDN